MLANLGQVVSFAVAGGVIYSPRKVDPLVTESWRRVVGARSSHGGRNSKRHAIH